jgi:hypothetical protein
VCREPTLRSRIAGASSGAAVSIGQRAQGPRQRRRQRLLHYRSFATERAAGPVQCSRPSNPHRNDVCPLHANPVSRRFFGLSKLDSLLRERDDLALTTRLDEEGRQDAGAWGEIPRCCERALGSLRSPSRSPPIRSVRPTAPIIFSISASEFIGSAPQTLPSTPPPASVQPTPAIPRSSPAPAPPSESK